MALVQQNGGTTNGSASIVTSLGSATTTGNTILIFANGAGTISTPSGFTSRSSQVNDQGLYLFEKLVATGNASDTPTLTMSGAFNATWQIAEYNGITAFDVSSGNKAGFGAGIVTISTPSITPTTGTRQLVAVVAASSASSTGTFTAGDPQAWSNSFVGKRSDLRTGTTGSGRDSMAGGWAERSGVTGNGSTTYATSATITSATSAAPATIIASYKVTGSGTAYTLTAAVGAVVEAGPATGLRAARFNRTTVGAVAVSGTTTGLRVARFARAVVGAIALAGPATVLRYARIMSAVQGSVVVTRFMGGLIYSGSTAKRLMASLGTITVTGVPAALLRTTTQRLLAQTGSIVLQGYGANLVAMKLEVQPGRLEFGHVVYLRRW